MAKTLVKIHEDVPASHYDQGIKTNLLQKYWHYRRFKEVINILKPIEGKILDIGCHSGTFTKEILKKLKTKQVFGIDISPAAIKKIKQRIPYGKFQVCDAHFLPFKESSFDMVFCLEMLEHVDNPQMVLEQIKKVLKKGGYGIILVPTNNKLFKIIWFLWTLYYPVWRHAHVQNFTQSRLENLIKKAGLKIKTSKTFNFGMLKLIRVVR